MSELSSRMLPGNILMRFRPLSYRTFQSVFCIIAVFIRWAKQSASFINWWLGGLWILSFWNHSKFSELRCRWLTLPWYKLLIAPQAFTQLRNINNIPAVINKFRELMVLHKLNVFIVVGKIKIGWQLNYFFFGNILHAINNEAGLRVSTPNLSHTRWPRTGGLCMLVLIFI